MHVRERRCKGATLKHAHRVLVGAVAAAGLLSAAACGADGGAGDEDITLRLRHHTCPAADAIIQEAIESSTADRP